MMSFDGSFPFLIFVFCSYGKMDPFDIWIVICIPFLYTAALNVASRHECPGR